MTHVMCGPSKKIFTLVAFILLTMISPKNVMKDCVIFMHEFFFSKIIKIKYLVQKVFIIY